MSKTWIWPPLGAALLLVTGVYAWWLWPRADRPSAEVLEKQALTAISLEEREPAAAQLANWGETSKEHMRRVLAQSDSPAVRSLMIQGLGNIYDYDSMDLFLAALEDKELLVRARTAVVVERMLGKSFAFVPDGPEPGRKQAVAHTQAYWKQLQGTPQLEAMRQKRNSETTPAPH